MDKSGIGLDQVVRSSFNRALVIDPSGELRDFLRFCSARFWPKLQTVSHLWARGCPDETFDWTGIELVLLEQRLYESHTSGINWLRALKRNPAAPPVVFITGGLTEDLRLEAEQAGAAAVLNKDDLSPRQFAECVESILQARNAQPDARPDAPADGSATALAEAQAGDQHAPERPQPRVAEPQTTRGDHIAAGGNSTLVPRIPGFTVLRSIRTTARGWVTLALEEGQQREVVLKILRIGGGVDVGVLRRFSHEYTSLKFLNNAHVIRVFGRGFAQNCAFVCLEYCGGGDLRQKIAGGVSISETVDYLTQIMHALKDVHARGILHRDIKPGNLLLREDESLVLTDFGIERELSDTPRLSAANSLLGDLNYLSPESIRDGVIDARSDLYSAGAVLYHLLTGAPPFADLTAPAVLEAHLRQPVPRLPPRLAGLQPLVDGLLAKNPDERFQSAQDVLDGIDWLCRESA